MRYTDFPQIVVAILSLRIYTEDLHQSLNDTQQQRTRLRDESQHRNMHTWSSTPLKRIYSGLLKSEHILYT